MRSNDSLSCSMQIVNKPITYTAAKLLVLIWKEKPFTPERALYLPSGMRKTKLADALGITVDAMNNVLTELVVTRFITRIKKAYYTTKEEYVEEVKGVYKVKSVYEFRD